VSSSHVVFTSSSSVIKPLVTDVLTLRCHLRDGATTAIIGKRHAVSEVNSQGQVKSDVIVGGQVVFDVIPGGQVDDGVTYRNSQPSDVSFVHSLVITKDGADIATVTEHGGAMAFDKTTNINVTGHIPGSGAEKGFLEVTWKHPGADQSGNYQCTVLGTDQFGHFQTFKETVEVTDDSVSMNDVIDYIQQLKLTNDLLKTTNDLQAAAIASLNQSVDTYTSTIESLNQSVDTHTSKIASLKHSNDLHTSTIANQSKAISELNQKNTDLEIEMAEVKQKQNTTVMFSAWLDHLVTLSSDDVVIFNQEITNIGQHYNPSTGVFTCPVSGYYVIDVHVMGQYDKFSQVVVRLNGARLVDAWAEDQIDYSTGSGHVSVVLTQGDEVDVVAGRTSYMNGNDGRFCMFSGHLVNLL